MDERLTALLRGGLETEGDARATYSALLTRVFEGKSLDKGALERFSIVRAILQKSDARVEQDFDVLNRIAKADERAIQGEERLRDAEQRLAETEALRAKGGAGDVAVALRQAGVCACRESIARAKDEAARLREHLGAGPRVDDESDEPIQPGPQPSRRRRRAAAIA